MNARLDLDKDTLLVVEVLNERSMQWLRDHCQDDWEVFCLRESDGSHLDFVYDCESVDLTPHFFDLTELSFELLESDLDRLAPITKKLSLILGLDVSTALHRYLLERYYFKKARTAKIQAMYGLGGHNTIYVDANYILRDGFLDVVSLDPWWRKYKPIVGFCRRAAGSLRNIFRHKRSKTDLLFLLDSLEVDHLSDLLDMLPDSGIDFRIVDKTYRHVLPGCHPNSRYFWDQSYRYLLQTIIAYAWFLSARIPLRDFLVDFMVNALISKHRAQNLYEQFPCKLVWFQNEYDIFQSIDYHQFKRNHVTVLNFMHGEKMFMLRDALAEYDNLLVWGRYYQELFGRLRYQGAQITVVGNPAFDAIKHHRVTHPDLIETRRSYQKIISVYPQPTYGFASVEWQTQMMKDVCQYAGKAPDVLVLVKHHPAEFRYPTPDYDRLIGGLVNVRRYHGQYSLYDLIAVSDLILTPYSTVGLEAILFKKNVLYVNYGAVKHLVPYALEGSAMEIHNSVEFEHCVEELLNSTMRLNHQHTIDQHAYGLDGQATRRICSQIVQCLP